MTQIDYTQTGKVIYNEQLIAPNLQQGTISASTNPTVTDDSDSGYAVGSRWINESTDTVFICFDATVGAAVWTEVFTEKGPTAVSSSSYTWLEADRVLLVDTTSNAISITIPNSFVAAKKTFTIIHVAGNAEINPITITPTSATIMGETDAQINTSNTSLTFISTGTDLRLE